MDPASHRGWAPAQPEQAADQRHRQPDHPARVLTAHRQHQPAARRLCLHDLLVLDAVRTGGVERPEAADVSARLRLVEPAHRHHLDVDALVQVSVGPDDDNTVDELVRRPRHGAQLVHGALFVGLLGEEQRPSGIREHTDLVRGEDHATGMAQRHGLRLQPRQLHSQAGRTDVGQTAVQSPFLDVGWVDVHVDALCREQLRPVAGPRGEHDPIGCDLRSRALPVSGIVVHTATLPDVSAPTLGPGVAVVTMELERGVVGDLATMRQLADAAAGRGTLGACGRLVDGARARGVPVIHCIAEWRADRRGTTLNTPLTVALARNPDQILTGSDAVQLVEELGDTSTDLTSVRRHGLTPFTGTDLDVLLRSIGVDTVVACGVSLNVGVFGLCLTAADLGYRVVVPTDAVVGVPAEYGDEVLTNSLAMVASLTTVDALIG